jgi:hypothetical protein
MISVFTEKQVEWLQLIKRSKQLRPMVYKLSPSLFDVFMKMQFPPGFIAITSYIELETRYEMVINAKTQGILDNI